VANEKEKRPALARLAVPVYQSYLRLQGFKPSDLEVRSIGHSHIDAAWKWRVPETHGKVKRTFSQAVGNMEQRDYFTFSQSQPAFYEWMMEEEPELFARMIEMEKKGKWEITGGMWVEPDGNIPSGESFVRQRLLGQRFYLDHFGHIARIGWLPDTFGYNNNLPQILARSGAEYLWAKKINTNFETEFPFHNFVWRSPDGSEVLTTLNSMSVGLGFFCYQEVGKFEDRRYLVREGGSIVADYSWDQDRIDRYISDDWMPEIANFYGEGDGDQGPTYIEIEIQEALRDRGYTQFSDAMGYFKDLEDYRERLPVWTDELYLERHRGTLTTQAWIKRANRKAEQMMRTVETLHFFVGLFGGDHPSHAITKLWKAICFNQFHDILPGSSIPEVYVDAKEEYDRIEREYTGLINAAMARLAALVDTRPPEKGLSPVLVWNTLPWQRDGLSKVAVPAAGTGVVRDGKGRAVPSQYYENVDGRWLVFRATEVPGTGWKTYFRDPDAGESPQGDVRVTESANAYVLQNSMVKVEVDKGTGWITSLVNKETGDELIGGPSFRIRAFHERAKSHRAWDINPNYTDKPIPLPEAARVKVIEDGPLFVGVEAQRQVQRDGRLTTFVQKIRLVEGDPVVWLSLYSDFHMDNALVKLEFNSTVETDKVAADGPYTVIERPTRPDNPREKARWEMSNQMWVDLSDGEKGLALLNRGKYGFSLTRDGKGIRQSVIKAAEYPEAYADAVDVEHYKKGELPYTDQGEHFMELGLLAHEGGWREARLWEAGNSFNNQLESGGVDASNGRLPASGSFLGFESGSSYIGAIKRAEDDGSMVVRVVEAIGEDTSARVTPGPGIAMTGARETDLIELNPLEIKNKKDEVQVEVKPFAIKTIKIEVEATK